MLVDAACPSTPVSLPSESGYNDMVESINDSSSDSVDVVVQVDDFAEAFSPPRIGPVCLQLGLVFSLAMDILTGWDFRMDDTRARAISEVNQRMPRFLGLSPPCTMYSRLQHMNLKNGATQQETAEAALEGRDAIPAVHFFIGKHAGATL